MNRLRSFPPARRFLEKNIHRWVGPWLSQISRSMLRQELRDLREVRPLHHLMFCYCDHYEPEWGLPGPIVGEARVKAWQHGYPRAFSAFRDAEGRPPQHSFFFPGEEYRPQYLDRLTELVNQGFGEIELHLHHAHDTADALRQKIEHYLQQLGAHGHFSRPAGHGDKKATQMRYGFIHGNWALANAHGDGTGCGVDEELLVLFDTGCYADFTFPSAPHPTQPHIVNQLYWPTGDLTKNRSYEHGEAARVGGRREDRILIVEGPLALDVRPDRLLPRIEAAAITATDPPTPHRVRTWVRQGICVTGRPEWVFVKIHTHGAPEPQAAAILGMAGQAMHRELTTHFNDGIDWALHYVNARELYNIACAAMDGHEGDPAAFRDYLLPPPSASPRSVCERRPGPGETVPPFAPVLLG